MSSSKPNNKRVDKANQESEINDHRLHHRHHRHQLIVPPSPNSVAIKNSSSNPANQLQESDNEDSVNDESTNAATDDYDVCSYSCSHVSELRSRVGPHPFKNIQTLLRFRPPGRASFLGDGPFLCGACGHAPPQLYACLECAAVFCSLHAPGHAAESSDLSHAIAVDVDRAELFCCVCKDQVYDNDFDAAVVVAAFGSVAGPRPESLPPENLRKRRRVDYKPWTPDPNERVMILENSTALPSQLGNDTAADSATASTAPDPPWGLRGLNNLGNTCFMNSVLQALLHTPPLRNFFLSDKHNRYFCQRKDSSIVTRKNDKNANANAKKICLACDLDAMFSAVFSGDRVPYSPAKFLYSWWQHASNLASYEQQDAHEFFISILDGIHEKVQKDKQKPQSQGS